MKRVLFLGIALAPGSGLAMDLQKVVEQHCPALAGRDDVELASRGCADALRNALATASPRDPRYGRTWSDFGYAEMNAGRFERAIEPLRRGAKLDAINHGVAARQNLGVALAQLKRGREAAAVCREIARLSLPESRPGMALLTGAEYLRGSKAPEKEVLRYMDDYDKLVSTKAADYAEWRPVALHGAGVGYFNIDRPKETAIRFERYAKLFPNRFDTVWIALWAASLRGSPRTTDLAFYDELARRHPTGDAAAVPFHVAHARVLWSIGRRPQAIEVLRKALAVPKRSDAYAPAYEREEGLALLSRYEETFPENERMAKRIAASSEAVIPRPAPIEVVKGPAAPSTSPTPLLAMLAGGAGIVGLAWRFGVKRPSASVKFG